MRWKKEMEQSSLILNGALQNITSIFGTELKYKIKTK